MIEELFYDLENGGEIEPGIMVAINMHKSDALNVICSRSEGRLVALGQEAPIDASGSRETAHRRVC